MKCSFCGYEGKFSNIICITGFDVGNVSANYIQEENPIKDNLKDKNNYNIYACPNCGILQVDVKMENKPSVPSTFYLTDE